MRTWAPLKRNLFIEIILAIACLFLPFVFMKIGPGGYAYYGPTVPDIYILGGYILGKDVSWWGINFAYKFQFICIWIYIGLSMFSFARHFRFQLVFTLQVVRLFLLFCFPFWMFFYQGHVQNNSDCADLTVYPHIGWIAYISLLYIHIRIFMGIRQQKNGVQTTTIYRK